MERFFQRNHDVGLDIAAAFRSRPAPAKLSRGAAPESGLPATAAEECLEKIAESRPAKFKLDAAPIAAPERAAVRALSPPWRRLETATRLVPVRPELIVSLPLLLIAQDLVGLIDLFELLLRPRLVLRHVGMELARQLPKCRLDFVIACRFRDAEGLVIIAK